MYAPGGHLWWARSYAVLPTADVLDDRVIRIYFASLDVNRFGRIGFVDLDAGDPKHILYESQEPVLDIGEPGTFDDCGVNASSIVNVAGGKYLYYVGWQRCERVPYMLFSGMAVSKDSGGTWSKHARIPVLDRTDAEPSFRSAPFVKLEEGTFKVWYTSCVHWSNEGGWVHYNNVIRYAESKDGYVWDGINQVCFAPEGPDDYAVGRPCILREGELYKMWYSIRSRQQITYRIGYAESADGVTWVRKDNETGIDPSETGWDSEMICYPFVVDAGGKRYMFYNGNRHGSTGFGCAVLDS